MADPIPYLQTAAAQSLPVGYQLGEYVIEAVLGHGGFGITYRARDTQLGAEVAIKEYFPQVYATRSERSTIVPRPGADLENYRWGLGEFLKEAQVLAKFKHPHIVRVLRFLEANGTAYTIMEYEQGETLASWLDKHSGRLDEPTLLRIFLPTLNGLQAVHDAGLLHLDIKPDNIYLRKNGEPVLIDFGSSRQMRGLAALKVSLTPGYCALEQYPGHGDIGERADVYGIGATLYRCLTGTRPIDALERQTTFARSHIDPLRPAVSLERPFYSAHIRQCVDAALKLSAQERPASAHVLQQGLMGKDMSQVGKPVRSDVVRIGQGFIGASPPPPPRVEKWRRRYSFFEKAIAVLVFVATFAIVIPKFMIDTGRMSEDEIYTKIDATKADLAANARALGDMINERVFGVPRRPETSTPPPVPRASAAPSAPVAAEPAAPLPFGADMAREADVTLPEPPVQAFALLKHGTVYAFAADNGPVRLADAQTGVERTTVPARVAGAAALGVFPSSQWFVVADIANALVVLDPLGNRDTVIADDLAEPISAIAVSTENRLLAAAGDGGQITVWSLSPTRRLHTLPIDGGRTQAIAFTPDERRLVVGGVDGSLTLWDMEDGRRIAHWRGHGQRITALAWSPDGRRLATAGGGEARLWTLDDAPPTHPTPVPGAKAQHLAFSPDGRWLIVAGATAGVRVFDSESGTLAHELATDGRGVRVLAVARDGKLLAVLGEDNVVRRWR